MSTKGNITLCLTSLAAGAVLGLLLAPASGKETRRNLVRRTGEVRDKLSDLYEEGTEYISRTREQFADVADRARDTARDAASEVRSAASGRSNTGTSGQSGSSSRQATGAQANGGGRS